VRQVVAASALSLHSSDLDLVGQGTLTVPTKALDGHMGFIAVGSTVGAGGTDLARFTREGNRIVLPRSSVERSTRRTSPSMRVQRHAAACAMKFSAAQGHPGRSRAGAAGLIRHSIDSH
jgi:hypothetical protein